MNDQLRELEQAIQTIAYQAGHEYGLRDSEFAIRLIPPKKLGGQGWLVKWGQIYRLYWSIGLQDLDKFEGAMRRALKAITYMKRQKKTDLVMWDGLRHPPVDVPNAYRSLYNLAPILDHNEVEYELFYKVVMKHKVTGVVMEMEHPVTKGVTKLVNKARESLTELVTDVVKQLMEQQPVENAQCAGGSLSASVPLSVPEPQLENAGLDTDSYLTTDGERAS
jgi:hypothetical protein